MWTLLREGAYALVLVNRKLDRDQSEGIEVIKQIKEDPELADVPVMLITNYAEYQEAAIATGATRGFSKLKLDQEETLKCLRTHLG
jgi:CheY-like chemotaxis protein